VWPNLGGKLSIRAGWVYFALVGFFLYLPIAMLIVFSFNDSTFLTFPLKGFTLRWYAEVLRTPELIRAITNTVVVGLAASLISTVLGAMSALLIARYDFPGRDAFISLASFPLVIPYVVLGVSLLLLLNQVGIPLSLWTVTIGHVIINTPYAMLIIAARLAGFDPDLEEASMDLGASYWETLGRVTLPIAAPALAASLLSSFTTSFDEFALTFFLTGQENTLPIYLYSQLRFPSRLPLAITVAAIVIVASTILLAISEWLRYLGTEDQ
jgi:spermidine/putrescine transport system permease protein